MTRCLDTDTLATVGAALEWDVEAGARHLLGCASCQDTLRQLASAHAALAEEVPPRAGFIEDVMRALPVDEPEPVATGWKVADLVNPALAAVTALAVIVAGAGDALSAPAVPMVAAAFVALGTALWNRRAGAHPIRS